MKEIQIEHGSQGRTAAASDLSTASLEDAVGRSVNDNRDTDREASLCVQGASFWGQSAALLLEIVRPRYAVRK